LWFQSGVSLPYRKAGWALQVDAAKETERSMDVDRARFLKVQFVWNWIRFVSCSGKEGVSDGSMAWRKFELATSPTKILIIFLILQSEWPVWLCQGVNNIRSAFGQLVVNGMAWRQNAFTTRSGGATSLKGKYICPWIGVKWLISC
jgi:hypothetical protein